MKKIFLVWALLGLVALTEVRAGAIYTPDNGRTWIEVVDFPPAHRPFRPPGHHNWFK